jgi:hypothetical protein
MSGWRSPLVAAQLLDAFAHAALVPDRGIPRAAENIHQVLTEPCALGGLAPGALAQGSLAVPQVALEALLVPSVGAQTPNARIQILAETLALAGLCLHARGSKQQEGEGEKSPPGGEEELGLAGHGG